MSPLQKVDIVETSVIMDSPAKAGESIIPLFRTYEAKKDSGQAGMTAFLTKNYFLE